MRLRPMARAMMAWRGRVSRGGGGFLGACVARVEGWHLRRHVGCSLGVGFFFSAQLSGERSSEWIGERYIGGLKLFVHCEQGRGRHRNKSSQ